MEEKISEVGQHTHVQENSGSNMCTLLNALYQVTQDENVKNIFNISEFENHVFLLRLNEEKYYFVKICNADEHYTDFEVVTDLPVIDWASDIAVDEAETTQAHTVFYQKDKYTDEVEHKYSISW
ncbi:MAG: hypothetical protein IKD76_08505 [Clostridia bacterium]|nr:hypothetical protein [Clostridia bacterium]